MRFLLLALLLTGCAHPPATVPPGMIEIPAGPALLGADDVNAFFQPQSQRQVAAFCIDKLEVTKAEYARFDSSYSVPKGQENTPVTHVRRDQAEAYLQSVGKRLPSAEEWEKAARGNDGRRYPWGNDWNYKKGNLTEHGRDHSFCSFGRMKPVGSFPQGASPYGLLDMCGNAWEWVSDDKDGRPVIRGGAYGYRERECRAWAYATEDVGYT